MLSESQVRAVKFYEGDVAEAYAGDPFWGDGKAYVALNSLFYPGIGAERRRAAEGKRLNPAIAADPKRLFRLCADLISACQEADLSHDRTAYRVERHADFLQMRRAARTMSFTSTSTQGFLRAYGDRIGIALLEFRIPAGAPCLPFDEVLRGDYAKGDEHEILLPPGLPLAFQDAPLGEYDDILDAQGNPPIAKCLVTVGMPCDDDACGIFGAANFPDATAPSVFGPEGPAATARVYEALNADEEPDPHDVACYQSWKAAFNAEVLLLLKSS